MRMKALKTFRVGDTGEMVRPGVEFETKNHRVYEQKGLAVGVGELAKPSGEPEPVAAAETGPLASPGGKTGEAKPLLSSRLVHPRKATILNPSEAKPESSPSTSRGGSARGRKSSTDATEPGGDQGEASQNSEE